MIARGGRWLPRYEGDEIVLGVALAFAVHAIPIVIIVIGMILPKKATEEEQPIIAKPVVAATLLKLGKIDPAKLPDRFVPRARTAPQKEVTASRDEPLKKHDPPDGGPPPPNTQDSDLQRLIAKSDPFAEDAGKDRPEEGHPGGVDGGTETDPSRVHAGDAYAAALAAFFHEHWQIPTVISQGEANRLCVGFRLSLTKRMSLFHYGVIRNSGNDLFDDSVKSMLQKLMDDATALPPPPPEIAEQYQGRTVSIVLSGNPHGDPSKCK